MPPKVIGITGGIGSGKSIISRVLKVLDFFVYDADQRAKELVYQKEIKFSLINVLGTEVFTPQGVYNKPYVAQQIFSNPSILKSVNSIIHPAVKNDFSKWKIKHYDQKIIFKEAAIIFESGTYKQFDKIILVTAPEKIRLQRVMKRDGADISQIKKRMQNQWDDDEKLERSDFVIENDDHKLILPQLYNILNELK